MWLRWSGHDGIRTLHHGAGLARGWTERDVDGLDGWVALVEGRIVHSVRPDGRPEPVVHAEAWQAGATLHAALAQHPAPTHLTQEEDESDDQEHALLGDLPSRIRRQAAGMTLENIQHALEQAQFEEHCADRHADAGHETAYTTAADTRAEWQRIHDHTATTRAERYDPDHDTALQHALRREHHQQDVAACARDAAVRARQTTDAAHRSLAGTAAEPLYTALERAGLHTLTDDDHQAVRDLTRTLDPATLRQATSWLERTRTAALALRGTEQASPTRPRCREMSAGPTPLRENFRTRYATEPVLMPPEGVGTEAGTVGTAIDQRLRLAFTAADPVDLATYLGIDISRGMGGPQAGERMGVVGEQLLQRLAETVHALDLDNRDLPLDRSWEEEQDLARLLLAAAWYQVAARNPYGFTYTPLFLAAVETPKDFTLERLLDLPHRALADDVTAQLDHAATGPLQALRATTDPASCEGGVMFAGIDITADADLLANGTLIEIKSTRHPHRFEKATAWQILGYLLLDTPDNHRIDTVGLYLTRTATLATWPVEDYLALLGARCRDPPGTVTALAGFFLFHDDTEQALRAAEPAVRRHDGPPDR